MEKKIKRKVQFWVFLVIWLTAYFVLQAESHYGMLPTQEDFANAIFTIIGLVIGWGIAKWKK